MSTSDFMAPSIKSAKSGKGNAKSGIELGGVRKASGSSRRDEGIGNNAAQQDPHRKLSQLMLDRMHLEMENNEMEQRLEQLRFSMQKEREERQSAGGYRWKSGQTGNLTYPNQGSLQDKENSVKASPGRMKLKILKDPGPVKQPVVPKLSYSAVVENTRFKGKACGQCDDRNAMLTCLECAEDYCVSCFTKFHHKGGLKFHRTAPFQATYNPLTTLETYPSDPGSLVDIPMQGRYAPVPKLDVPKLDIAEQVKKEIERDLKKLDAKLDSTKEMRSHSLPNNPSPETGKSFSAESVSTSSTFPVDEKPSGGALLQGTFNEAESSDSFKEILTDWRNSKSDYKTKHKVHEVNPGRADSPEGFMFSHLGGSHHLGHSLGKPVESLITKPEYDFKFRSEMPMKHDEEEKTKHKSFPLRAPQLVFEGQRGSTEELVDSINGLRRMAKFDTSNQKKSMDEMCRSIDTLGSNIGALAKHLVSMQSEQSYNSQLVSWAICRGIELLGIQNDFTNPKINANVKREDLAATKTKETVKDSATRHTSLPRHPRRAHGSSQIPLSSHISTKSKSGKRKKDKSY